MRARSIGAGLVVILLAACSGGGGAPSSGSGGGGGATTTSLGNAAATADSIATVDGVGVAFDAFSSTDANTSSTLFTTSSVNRRAATQLGGSCVDGLEFFVPDSAGDAHSTETRTYFDAACTQLARDAVRIVSASGGGSETVTATVAITTTPGSVPSVRRASTTTIANAVFDAFGLPVAADGFSASTASTLTESGATAIAFGDEIVIGQSASGTTPFCGDGAGYGNPASLGEAFGWSGGVLTTGTRVVNADGSVTWTATPTGTGYTAAGGFSLTVGTPNATCPIATPAYALSGGTVAATYSIPLVATFRGGVLVSASVTNATLSDNNTLTFSTTPGASPASSGFITGTISHGKVTIATFSADAFGDGTLTIAATGQTFAISDWHIVT